MINETVVNLFSDKRNSPVILDLLIADGPIQYVPRFLFDQGCILAGGSLMRALIGQFDPQKHDIDMWINRFNKKTIKYIKKLMEKQGWTIIPEDKKKIEWYAHVMTVSVVTKYEKNGIKIDLIEAEYNEDPIEIFDINMSCLSYHPDLELNWNDDFEAGLKNKLIRPIQKNWNDNRTWDRIKKYCNFLKDFTFKESDEYMKLRTEYEAAREADEMAWAAEQEIAANEPLYQGEDQAEYAEPQNEDLLVEMAGYDRDRYEDGDIPF